MASLENYIYLTFGWIAYCAIHSLLATNRLKTRISDRAPGLYRYYRLVYSAIAFITLILILWYQLRMKEHSIIGPATFLVFAGYVLIAGGLSLMAISAKKYFLRMTGFDLLFKKQPNDDLLEIGIHKKVRHPLYLGTLLFIYGLLALFFFPSNLLACLVITVYIIIGIKLEEKKLVTRFGKAYLDYKARVPILPRLRSGKKKLGTSRA
ncbi:MAG TPA: isoprenylcysteine carboxylmethyltransferase family protein [Puia sp.]|nr:isoprenylcysteine carboxylmethyltransferase family protein [Puia sp.]